MVALDVKVAKRLLFEIISKISHLVSVVDQGALHGCLFVDVMRSLLDFCKALDICLVIAVQAKQEVNITKYPVKLNQGTIVNYKLVSSETGIDRNSAADIMVNLTEHHCIEPITGEWMDAFLVQSQTFVKDRKWSKYEQPRMLCLAMMEEVGELCGVLKFVDDNEQNVSSRVYGEIVSEICDVYIYFSRLADLCGFFEFIKKEATA
jgi:NTP pyrophosphatase (non-canonical NTP hydrolase)